ncbi:MAG: DNA-binding NarL/FixJ family response regulator [Verrucomicrobiales bacterium]|jgi:DNA-binding NarL/FixJ family response regulator
MKQIAIIDDHPALRYGLKKLIESQEGLDVCGECDCAADALELITQSEPDLALVDLSLPDKNGLELIKDIRAQLGNQTKLLVVSMHDETLYAERVIKAGGQGYIMKEEAAEKLIEAIHSVLDGRIYVSSRVSARLIEMLAGTAPPSLSPLDRLTDRELEVFRLIGQGKASREIARLTNISARTVDSHRSHIKEKLGYPDGPTLVAQAVRWVEADV